MSTKDEGMTVSPNGQQTDVSRRLFGWLVRKFSKWTVVEVYYFDCSWYVVQVRQNLRTGYKHFSCKKIVKYHYGTKAENLTPARLEALVNGG